MLVSLVTAVLVLLAMCGAVSIVESRDDETTVPFAITSEVFAADEAVVVGVVIPLLLLATAVVLIELVLLGAVAAIDADAVCVVGDGNCVTVIVSFVVEFAAVVGGAPAADVLADDDSFVLLLELSKTTNQHVTSPYYSYTDNIG